MGKQGIAVRVLLSALVASASLITTNCLDPLPPDPIVVMTPKILNLNAGTSRAISLSSDRIDLAQLTWSCSNPKVATVNSEGVVEGHTDGSATIVVSHEDKALAISNVYVTGVISIDQGNFISMRPNDILKLTATVTGYTLSADGIVWQLTEGSSDEIDLAEDGTVTAVGIEGEFTVNASLKFAPEITDDITIRIRNPGILSFGFDPDKNSMQHRWDSVRGGPRVQIDEFNDAITVEFLNHYTDLDITNLIPTFETIPGATVSVGGEEQHSGVTPNDYSSPVVYTVQVEDLTRNYVVSVKSIPRAFIPDDNFRATLQVNFPDAFDGELLDTSANAVVSATILDASSSEIRSLNGIEFFPNLTGFGCGNNLLTELDLSHNTSLKILWCNSNAIERLDLSNNRALEELYCHNNSLMELILPATPTLSKLSCTRNSLTRLDTDNSPNLLTLACSHNLLNDLNLDKNPLLNFLVCANNKLTKLELSSNLALSRLNCNDNLLTTLDLSRNPALTWMECHKNSLTTLKIGQFVEGGMLKIGAGEIVVGSTFNPLTTLTVPEDLRGHDEIEEAIANRGDGLSVSYVQ